MELRFFTILRFTKPLSFLIIVITSKTQPEGSEMAERSIYLRYPNNKTSDAKWAATILKNPTRHQLSKCIKFYGDLDDEEKKMRRRTLLICALCLIDDEIGISEILHAIDVMTSGTNHTKGEVDEEFAKELISFMKADVPCRRFMRKIVQTLKEGESMDDIKHKRKYELRLAILRRKLKTNQQFSIVWY